MTDYDKSEVEKALGKQATYGADIDLNKYDEGDRDVEQIEDIRETPDELRDKMLNVGVEADDDRKEGTILFIDNAMRYAWPRGYYWTRWRGWYTD